jgi:hypothetical protein
MPEGLKNSGSTFSRLTKSVLEKHLGETSLPTLTTLSSQAEMRRITLLTLWKCLQECAKQGFAYIHKSVCLVSAGQNIGLPCVPQRHLSQPNQRKSNHGHATSTINKRHSKAHRKADSTEQIHLSACRTRFAFSIDAKGSKRLRLGP